MGQVVDPAQERDDDQRDHADGYDEQHHAPACAIGAGLQDDDADDAEQERADEGREHVLGDRVFPQEPCGAWRDSVRGRAIGRGHHIERECGHRQHARGDDGENAVDCVGADVPGQLPGDVILGHRGEHRRSDAEHADQRRPEPQAARDMSSISSASAAWPLPLRPEVRDKPRGVMPRRSGLEPSCRGLSFSPSRNAAPRNWARPWDSQTAGSISRDIGAASGRASPSGAART